MPVHDLKCDAGHLLDDVFHSVTGLPLCPDCGAKTSISWHGRRAPGVNGFGTVTTDGGTMSTMDFEKHKRTLESRNPGMRVKTEYLSDNQIDQRIDARKSRIAANRKARGVNIDAVRDERVDRLERKKERVLRDTLPPEVAKKKVAALNHKIVRNKATLTT
jgi:hypothetical protein